MPETANISDHLPKVVIEVMALKKLERTIKHLGRTSIAFSGGVDSTLLLRIALDSLGESNIMAIMATSPLLPDNETAEASEIAAGFGVRLHLVPADPLALEAVRQNRPDRCLHCKRHLLGLMLDRAAEEGFATLVEGTNSSDLGEFRPGIKALAEMEGVKSPFIECGITKYEIRKLARSMNLPNWNKPSQACLATRIPFGTRLTSQELARVDRAEARLREMGITQVRVRSHGNLARIEVDRQELVSTLIPDNMQQISETVKSCGFTYVTLDLDGYRSGSMNLTMPVTGGKK